jgi:hypothetical protein
MKLFIELMADVEERHSTDRYEFVVYIRSDGKKNRKMFSDKSEVSIITRPKRIAFLLVVAKKFNYEQHKIYILSKNQLWDKLKLFH